MGLKWIALWVRAYCDHPDPRVAASNAIALMVGANGPLYPIYVWLLVGRDFWPSLLTLLSTPLFCLVPAIARRSSLAGRVMLPIVGIINTLVCIKALGEPSGVALFLLPCIVIPALTLRPRERVLQLILVSLPSVIYLLGRGRYGAALSPYTAQQYAALASLNTTSVMGFSGFLGLVFAGVLTRAEAAAASGLDSATPEPGSPAPWPPPHNPSPPHRPPAAAAAPPQSASPPAPQKPPPPESGSAAPPSQSVSPAR